MGRAMTRLLLALALLAAPASAQDVPSDAAAELPPVADVPPPEGEGPPAPEVLDDGSDNLTVGLGAAYTPSYEGSDSYVVIPAAAVRGRVSGFRFQSRSTYLYVDLVPEGKDYALDLQLGPIAGVRLNRNNRIKDAQVRALGELDEAYEVGAFAGLSRTGVLHAYDTLGVRVDYVQDVSDVHDSHVITPSIEYSTPLSRTIFIGASLSAEYAGDGYARTYFGVTPAGAAASGLPAYDLDGGWKNWSLGLTTAYSLSGDLRRGLALFALGSYGRLLDAYKRSPVVAIAGDRDQFFAAAGLGYTF